MPTMQAHSFGHLVPSILGLEYILLVETSTFQNLIVILMTLNLKYPSYILHFTYITYKKSFQDGIDDSIFFLGASASGVSFHKHVDAWNGVIFGYKRWFLYPKEKTPPGG